ncbi:host specificity protein J [Xanthomonas translucens]|uniref:host specificity protein J n=1 Tax=Xanthomonas campestris pv. translucens TaxID=343 RepID=UPI00071E7CE8|nr:host specificity protein J [Xanthomonas translucens]QEN93658.1 host specificity protein J [Xanthomonas translucens pv. undulosa]QSQ58027.1 host specificity protein J [Xanthomonas translucens pv. undulosa]WLA02823.1 host specificity protein J [Xanthomonas translucens]
MSGEHQQSTALALRGAKKGGSSARTPIETPDSLQSIAYAKIIDLVSEGEIVGLKDGLRSIYLDGTPLQAADGRMNFQSVRVETRSGTQDQDYLAGFPSVENETSVNVELRSDQPVVRNFTNSDLSAVRVRLAVPQLQKTNNSNADIEGYSISYAIDVSTDGGAFTTVTSNAFTGKTTTLYERSYRVDLPTGSQWQIRVRRLTPNANSAIIADTTTVESMTEIIDAKLRYPNSALVGIEVDASQFQAIPARAYFVRGRIISVPTNYDPEARAYSGIWDGTFKPAWTNNPAWVFYDLVTNDRFGLGHRIPAAWVDRWRLYQIAQYCDQLVSDGVGGQEPRFVCNTYLQTRQDAYKLLQDMAAVFRGITYYAAGQVLASADMPQDPVYQFNQTNVIDGKFTYSGSARKVRHTVALVSWNDPDDFGRAKVETVEYRPGIARYGIQQTEVAAMGCTSRAQAQRIGLHILYTENLETETVTFGVGLEGVVPQPGDIIEIADPKRAGRRNGGRIRSASTQSVVLDVVPPVLAIGDTIRVLGSNGRSQARSISGIAGNTISVAAPWDTVPVATSVWSVSTSELALQTFRVLGITDGDGDDAITYQVTALKHVPGKFAAIDDGARIELPPISIIPPSVQPPPTNVAMSSHSVIDQGIATHVLTISWDAAPKAIAYDVEWRRDDMAWVKAGRATTTNMEVRGIYAGQYLARVRAVNALNAVSMPALSALTTIEGKTTPPPALTTLTASGIIFGIELAWTFPPGATDTQRTEIWYGQANVLANAIKLGDFAYPQAKHTIMGLAAGVQIFFWGRLVDRSGNIGPWYPLGNGVVGRSSTDADAILDYLTGKITASQLGQDLLAKVESIDDLLPLVWNPDATYSQGQTVIYEGQIYSWESSTAGNETPPGTNWKDVGDALAQVGAVVGQVNSNTQAISVLDGKVKAQGTKVDGIFAQLDVKAAGDTDWGAGDTNVYAGTITVQSVIASGDLAQAKRTDTVEANLGKTNASVQVTSQAVAALDGKASSSYIVKTAVTSGGQYYAAGIALGIDASGGTVQSSFLVHADMFGVLNSTGSDATVISPFVIQNGQTFINQAFIGDAWINSAKIADGAITNAKIGEYIQSFNYSEGKSGWRLSKDGNLDINGVGGGFRLRINNSGVYLFYDDGSPAVELGVLS